ncbi:ISL3 family transposase [Streptomyces sp. 4.24]|uniref:ISL3 family transposase n=1 Tax=Streptomyces tritrimontium TaxID=3406573 RepID=UPI003BB5460F
MGDHATELLKLLFPYLSQVMVDSVVHVGRSVRITARCIEAAARCPGCGAVEVRVHSRYGRRLADEAVGGQAGERLAAHLAVPVSGATLLRLIHRIELPPVPEVEVLGVDEFAFRRGRTFGAILLDMTLRCPVDVLPDHTSDTFAAWLRDHRHVRMICRDRGGAFAEGAERALPGVPQVADRWQLLHNLASAVEKTIRRHRARLKLPEPAPEPGAVPPEETPAQQQTRARWSEIRTLYLQGMRIVAISERTGLDRKTVHRYAHATTADELIQIRPGRRSTLTPHKPYLAERWAEGCDNAQTLRDAIAALGYKGGRKSVRHFLNSLAQQDVPRPAPPPPPAVADVVRWIVGRPENQSERARQHLKDICDRCPEIADACRLARAFATILRRRDGHRLGDWLTQVDGCEVSEVRTFANGLRKYLPAVTAGLTLAWISGAVEGNVTRIKLLKRQHYGRASFALLRRRILLAR